MGWYYASDTENGKPCRICGKPVTGKTVSNEAYQKSTFVETRDKVYLNENGVVEHAMCVWKANEANTKALEDFMGKL
jgi:hypothetical protein